MWSYGHYAILDFKIQSLLTHSFPMHPFLPPENIRGREKLHWEGMS